MGTKTEYRIVKDKTGLWQYSLERKNRWGKWQEIMSSNGKDWFQEEAAYRFRRQKATEMVLIDETLPEFSLKDGKVVYAS